MTTPPRPAPSAAELDAIMERHSQHESQLYHCWSVAGPSAHTDRGTLLAAVATRAAEVAGLRAALAAVVEAAAHVIDCNGCDEERAAFVAALNAARDALAKEGT